MDKAIKRAMKVGAPVLIWGPPGVGKTAAILSMSHRLNLHAEVVIASIREPSDFAGLPVVWREGEAEAGGIKISTVFAPPRWAERLARVGRGILFFDELSTAPPAVQVALLRVVLDRVVGDLELPAGIKIIAAANPPELTSGGWELSPPLANRFIHLQWKVDPGKWVREFPGYWGLPPVLPDIDERHWRKARSLTAAFIKTRPSLLFNLPKDEAQRGEAWPSPRTWDYASRALALALEESLRPSEILDLVVGAVGEGAGIEFITWVEEADLPDPEEILSDPYKCPLPDRGDRLYALLTSVVQMAISDLTAEKWIAAWRVLERAAREKAADIAAEAARTLARSKRFDLPLPQKEIEPFLPLLHAESEEG